jgi:hypothetical protein
MSATNTMHVPLTGLDAGDVAHASLTGHLDLPILGRRRCRIFRERWYAVLCSGIQVFVHGVVDIVVLSGIR